MAGTRSAARRDRTGLRQRETLCRHCERSEAIHFAAQRKNGLLRRGACHRARVRATRWLLAMTAEKDEMTNIVLDIDNLVVGLGKKPGGSRIIDGLSLSVSEGETLCLV